MWPFDIKRKKREAEERQREEERAREKRAGQPERKERRAGASPAFSAPYGNQSSPAVEPDSTPLFFGAGGYGGTDTGRCSSHDSHTSSSSSYDSGSYDSGGSSDSGSCSSSD